MSPKEHDILSKATELFNAFGYTSVGIDRIINESNVAKMTFYKYFPSKDNLITRCLEERASSVQNSILNSLDNIQNPADKLKGIFDWHEKWTSQDDFHGCMFVKAIDELPYHQESKNIVIQHKLWLTNLIHTLLPENIQNSKVLSLQIRMLLDGAIINENTFRDQLALPTAWQYVQNQLIKHTPEK